MRSLRAKILLLAALLVVLTQAGTITAVVLSANREVTRNAREDLTTAGVVLGRVMELRGNQLLSTMRILVTEPEMRDALAGGDRDVLVAALQRYATQAQADMALLMEADGRVLGGTSDGAAGPAALPGLVRQAGESGNPRALVRAGPGIYEMAAMPLPVTDGGAPRWLAMGLALDNQRAQRIAQLTGLDVAIIARTDAGTTVVGSSLEGVSPAPLVEHMAEHRDESDELLELTIRGSDYVGIHLPVIPGDTAVSLVLLESLESAMAPFRTVRLTALALGIVALLAALSGGALVARAITRPARQLADAALRIRGGDYSQAIDVRSDDELGMLAAAFNTMQSGIAERESHITYQARFDALTGLPNRLLALTRLEEAVRRAAAADGPVGLLVVGLGRFGDITASLGHEVGDALLSQAAERLRATIDARHTLARLEGDRFAVILEDAGLDAARALAEDLLRLLGLGLSVRTVNISLDAAVGIAQFPEHGQEPDQLLLRATVAQNDASVSQHRIQVYQNGREERRVRQLAILGDLRRAVRHDELKLYLQPKISLADGRVCGAEALVRWDHPTFGWLAPGEFIGIAEQFGSITLITRWALAAAVRECRLWVEEGLDMAVSVNLSGRDLLDQNLPMYVMELLRDHDLAPRHLTLEITEEALVRDFDHATLVAQCLRDMGVRISIDDFGTGYSSLGQIKNLPVDELKIDRTFVTQLPKDQDDAAIVRTAIDLAHSLGLDVVAEGVESWPALRWLANQGCEAAQGFLISRPMPAEAFGEWARRYVAEETAMMPAPVASAS